MKKITTLFAIVLLAFGFTACDNDYIEPINKGDNKEQEHDHTGDDHDHHGHDVAKVELFFLEGHLHGTNLFHENGSPEGVKYMTLPQKFTLEADEEGHFHLSDESPNKMLIVRSKVYEGFSGVLGLWINYFDKEGNNITGNFANAQHQHFFAVKNPKPNFDGDAEALKGKSTDDFIHYHYGDTDPWDKSNKREKAPFIGQEDPRGLKGYFWFNQERMSFDLEIQLYHSKASKEGSTYSTPSKAQATNGGVDFRYSIPVNVYAREDEYVEADSIDELSDDDKRYIESVMKAYGLTLEEAWEELDKVYNNPRPPHSDDGYWF